VGIMNFRDSLYNLISGLGTSKDKSSFATYFFSPLTQEQLEAAYRSDWISRKIVDIPAQDSTREWRAWQAENAQIEALEELEEALQIRARVLDALTMARLYGGAAIILGVDQGAPEEPLNVDAVGKGALKFVHVLSRYELSIGPLQLDVTSPWYREPMYYEARVSQTAQARVHPSRVVRVLGSPLLGQLALGESGWGDSVLQAVNDAVQNCGTVSGSIAAMMQEAKVDIISVPGLTENISTQEYRDRLTDRFQYANTAKSVINTLVLDKDETWNRVQTSFAGMHDLSRAFLAMAAGAADIPATRMLGEAPRGMNSTGISDIRNYYDKIASDQETKLSPMLIRLDEVIIRSALGVRDPDIHYEWNSLWQMDDSQKAEIALNKAKTYQIDVTSAQIAPEALRAGRQNQLIEDGFYPGLEEAIAEADLLDLRLPEPDPAAVAPDPAASAVPPAGNVVPIKRTAVGDSTPRSLYVRRDVLNGAEIARWARSQGLVPMPTSEMHVTILYSKTPVDWIAMGQATDFGPDNSGDVVIPPGGPRVVERLGDAGAVVLMFASSSLCWRHEDMVRSGASHDYDSYQPHVTITYDAADVDLEKVEPYRGAIELGPEIFEDIA
jgi:phage-related protein (TIGR01555 family)